MLDGISVSIEQRGIPVITVLHQNPGSQHGKTRGHLGSQIERKAETSLRVEKAPKTEIFQAWADSARSCHIPKSEAWRFHWSDEVKMHVTLQNSDEEWGQPKPDKKEKYTGEVQKAYGKDKVLCYSNLVSKIVHATGLGESTAKTRIREYTALGLTEQDEKKEYHIRIS